MSPLIHAEVGWLVALPLPRRRDRVLVTVAAVIPDVDGLSLLAGDASYEQWHHRVAHGLCAALVVAVVALTVSRKPLAAILAVAAFHTHVAMDLAGSGPGWPILYFWPFADVEWLPAWQWNLASWQNAAFGLTTTFLCLACALVVGRTPVELVSTRADARVVETIRRRFRRGAAASSSS